jgi:hypothetical protein
MQNIACEQPYVTGMVAENNSVWRSGGHVDDLRISAEPSVEHWFACRHHDILQMVP